MGLWRLPSPASACGLAQLFNPLPYGLLDARGSSRSALLRGRPRLGLRGRGDDGRARARRARSSSRCWPSQRDYPSGHWMDAASWPSGHSTNAMVFALRAGDRRPAALCGARGAARSAPADDRDGLRAAHARLALPERHLGGLLMATAWRALATIPLRSEVTVEPARAGAWRERCSPPAWPGSSSPGGPARPRPTRPPTRRSSRARWRSPRPRWCSAVASWLPQRLGLARRQVDASARG